MASIQRPSPSNLSNRNNPNSKRRRFQAPITSFFTPTATSSSGSEPDTRTSPSACNPNNNNYECPTFSSTPTLSHKVQSSLLTVGMRIRKSVPEGYKNKGALVVKGAYSYPDLRDLSTDMDGFDDERDVEEEGEEEQGGRYAELTPYCGIMKTGNLAVQTFPRSNTMMNGPSRRHQQLFNREGEVFSVGRKAAEVIALPTKKRGLETGTDVEDDETEMTMNFSQSSQSSLPSLTPSSSASSSFSFASSSTLPVPTAPPNRQILLPKLAGQKRVPRLASQLKVKGFQEQEQENRGQHYEGAAAAVYIRDEDFDEATFLQRREDVDGDLDVEMG